MDGNQAVQYLDSLIGRTLRVHATDTRIFVGTFKCTDAVGAFCYEFPFQHLFSVWIARRDMKTKNTRKKIN